MNNRNLFLFAAFVGTTLGGFIPSLFGADLLSGWAILWSTVGGVAAVVLAFRFVA